MQINSKMGVILQFMNFQRAILQMQKKFQTGQWWPSTSTPPLSLSWLVSLSLEASFPNCSLFPLSGRAPTTTFSSSLQPRLVYLSSLDPLSLFPAFSFFPSRPHLLSLRPRHDPRPINYLRPNSDMRRPGTLRGCRSPQAQLGGCQITAVAACVQAWWVCRLITEQQSSDEFDGDSWSQQVHFNLLFKMVPSVPDESVFIVSTHLCVKMKTLQVDLSQKLCKLI